MATLNDVRRIALSLPETVESTDRFAVSVRNKDKLKGFVWVWLERTAPGKARVPRPDVVALRVANLTERVFALGNDERHRNRRDRSGLRRTAQQRNACNPLLQNSSRCPPRSLR